MQGDNKKSQKDEPSVIGAGSAGSPGSSASEESTCKMAEDQDGETTFSPVNPWKNSWTLSKLHKTASDR